MLASIGMALMFLRCSGVRVFTIAYIPPGAKIRVRGGENPCPGTIAFGGDLEFKHAHNYNGRG